MGNDAFLHFNQDNYGYVYEKAGQDRAADEMSGEMFNDVIGIIMTSKQGQEVFSKYLAKKLGKEASEVGDQVSSYMEEISDALQGLIPSGNKGYKAQMTKYSDDLGKLAKQFIKALDGAIENYQSMAGKGTAEGEQKFSLEVTGDNVPYVNVDIDQHRFDGMNDTQMAREARKVIKEQIDSMNGKIGSIDGTDIYANHSTISHYGGAARRQYKKEGRNEAKFRASTEIPNLFKASILDKHVTFEQMQKETPNKHTEGPRQSDRRQSSDRTGPV